MSLSRNYDIVDLCFGQDLGARIRLVDDEIHIYQGQPPHMTSPQAIGRRERHLVTVSPPDFAFSDRVVEAHDQCWLAFSTRYIRATAAAASVMP